MDIRDRHTRKDKMTMWQNIVRNYISNNKTLIGKSFGTMSLKGFYMLLQMLIMPSYLQFLGDNRLSGLWLTIVSLISWIICFDFGIGNGLRTELVTLLAKGDKRHTREYISTSYFAIFCIVALILLGTGILISFVPVNRLFHISEEVISTTDLRRGLLIVLCGMAMQLLWNLVSSLLYALQKAVLPSILNIVSALIVLVYVKMPFHQQADCKFLHLCFVYAVSINLPAVFMTVIVFSKKLRQYCPSPFFVKKSLIQSVMKLGGQFFLLQIIWAIISKSNEFLVLTLSEAEAVVEYQVYYKLFSLVSTFAIVAMTPIWSAVTKAVTEKDYLWIQKTYRMLLLLSAAGALLEIVLIFPLQWLVCIWLRADAIIVEPWIAFLFAANNAILIFHAANMNIANGMVNLRVQLFFYPLAAVLNIIMAIIAVELFDHWIGVIISNIVVLVPFELLQCLDNRKIIRNKMLHMEVGNDDV